jgi:hypothetical protein
MAATLGWSEPMGDYARKYCSGGTLSQFYVDLAEAIKKKCRSRIREDSNDIIITDYNDCVEISKYGGTNPHFNVDELKSWAKKNRIFLVEEEEVYQVGWNDAWFKRIMTRQDQHITEHQQEISRYKKMGWNYEDLLTKPIYPSILYSPSK